MNIELLLTAARYLDSQQHTVDNGQFTNFTTRNHLMNEFVELFHLIQPEWV